MLYVLSIHLFVDLNSLCRWRIWTFLKGYLSFCFVSAVEHFEVSLSVYEKCVWSYYVETCLLWKKKNVHHSQLLSSVYFMQLCLLFQLKIMYLYNFIDGNWNGRSWEQINLSRIVSFFFSFFFIFHVAKKILCVCQRYTIKNFFVQNWRKLKNESTHWCFFQNFFLMGSLL